MLSVVDTVSSRALMALEPARAALEFVSLGPSLPLLASTPLGDGHVVLVLPGMLTGDGSTLPLRQFLSLRNYDARPWSLGTNLGRQQTIDALERRFLDLVERAGGPISMVGWSLGGVMARNLAGRYPEHVRQLVTLGSPIGNAARAQARQLLKRLSNAPVEARRSVRTAAIYSRSDAVVPWQIARVSSVADHSENIRVNGSHMGLGVHPAVLYVVADRLAQPLDSWRPFRPPWALSGLYPVPDRHDD